MKIPDLKWFQHLDGLSVEKRPRRPRLSSGPIDKWKKASRA